MSGSQTTIVFTGKQYTGFLHTSDSILKDYHIQP